MNDLSICKVNSIRQISANIMIVLVQITNSSNQNMQTFKS